MLQCSQVTLNRILYDFSKLANWDIKDLKEKINIIQVLPGKEGGGWQLPLILPLFGSPRSPLFLDFVIAISVTVLSVQYVSKG